MISAQEKVLPFHDYRNCTVGFKRGKEVVWPAVFELAYQRHWPFSNHQTQTNWIVRKDGKSGMLDAFGKELIPCLYDSLLVGSDTIFVAIKKGKYGLVSISGKELCAFEFQQLFGIPYTNRFKFRVGDKWGLLNSQFEKASEAIYTEIEAFPTEQYSYEGRTNLSTTYFRVVQEKLSGVFYIDRGEVIAPEYLYIEGHFPRSDLPFEPVFTCAQDSTFEIRTCDPKVFAKPVDRFHEFRIHFAQNYFSDEDRIPKVVLLDAKTGLYAAIDLKTGQQSAWYQQVTPYGHYYVVSDKREHVLLNRSFQEVYRSGKAYFKMPNTVVSAEDWYMELDDQEGYLAENESFIPFYAHVSAERDSAQMCSFLAIKYGFIYLISPRKNKLPEMQVMMLESGAVSTKKYDLVEFFLKDDEIYFWCYQFGSDQNGSAQLTILNDRLETVKKISCFPEYQRCIYRTANCSRPEAILVNATNDKMGGVRPDGSVAIPLIYDCLEPLHAESNSYYRHGTYDTYLLACLDKTEDAYGRVKKILLSTKGDRLLPIAFTNYVLYPDSVLLAYGSELGELYDKNLKLIQNDCRDVRSSVMLDYQNKYKLNVRQPNQPGVTIPAVYFVYDSILYCFAEGKKQRLDDTYFLFPSDSLVILNHYIINRNGKVLGYYTQPPKKSLPAPKEMQIQRSEFMRVEHNDRVYYWKGKYEPNGTSTWYLYDSTQRNLVHNFAFDFPILEGNTQFEVFKAGGKFGLLDGQFKILLPAEFDFIHLGSGILLYAKGKWRVYDFAKKRFSEEFDALGLNKYNTGRFVFRNDSIGFLDDSMRFSIPFMTKAQMKARKDVTKLCRYTKVDPLSDEPKLNFTVWDALILERNTNYFAAINAEFLVNREYYRNTDRAYLELNLVPFFPVAFPGERPKMYFTQNSTVIHYKRKYTLHFDNLYSQVTTTYFEDKVFTAYYNKPDMRLQEISTGTYWLRNGKIDTLTLKNIVKQDAVSKDAFKEIVYQKLNENQFKGVNCVDIERLLSVYEKQCYLHSSGLILYLVTNGELQSFNIPFSSIKQLLQPALKDHLHRGFYL